MVTWVLATITHSGFFQVTPRQRNPSTHSRLTHVLLPFGDPSTTTVLPQCSTTSPLSPLPGCSAQFHLDNPPHASGLRPQATALGKPLWALDKSVPVTCTHETTCLWYLALIIIIILPLFLWLSDSNRSPFLTVNFLRSLICLSLVHVYTVSADTS